VRQKYIKYGILFGPNDKYIMKEFNMTNKESIDMEKSSNGPALDTNTW
jgi:hypothetical protein